MAWIESHQGTDRHPKTRKFCRRLGLSVPAAVGHLHMFWWWAMDFADDGDISKFEPEDIADAMEYDGDSEALLTAMIDAGFIDQTETGRVIHDWYDYAGKLIERRKNDAQRKANSRRKPTEVRAESESDPIDVQRTSEGHPRDGVRNPNHNLNHNQEDIKDLRPEPPTADQDDAPLEPPADGSGTRKKKRPEYSPDSTYYKMAVYFKQKIDDMASTEGLTHLTDRTNLHTWADDFRKLVELDKQSDTNLIRSVMDWVVLDDFWKGNVLSAEKFRAQFPKLVMAMRRKSTGGQSSTQNRSSKPHIPIVDGSDVPAPPTPEEMAEMIKLAERLQAKNRGAEYGTPVAK
ncbi:MAG: hypothetical protein E6Y08_11400 [Paenibacillus sp.]|uniref:hypothetical protein n=1 Tax=Paenibacillus sp. TaxID=58172 RepID=UPI00291349A9|nr:hypothetical protein [Paenibacillus sp.]MDU4696414.1 hypothetical protein [Paenibacillus sp.]